MLSTTGILWHCSKGWNCNSKLQMCPHEGFLPAGHPGSSPTRPPCRRAWSPHRTGCRGRPQSAAGGPAPPSVQQPRRWTCQRAAPAAPAATWGPWKQPCSASGTFHRQDTACTAGQGDRALWFHVLFCDMLKSPGFKLWVDSFQLRFGTWTLLRIFFLIPFPVSALLTLKVYRLGLQGR